ncbi:TIR-like protein FxsC [Streptomyces sp. NPDC008141]|uniref:TIR-like protein FxsC n=1 Tax=unclassified Streptomyces TaxID=2593676 RepID=UPI0036F0D0F6
MTGPAGSDDGGDDAVTHPVGSPPAPRQRNQNPYFFLSYARTPSPMDERGRAGDPNKLVDDFHRELCEHILHLTDHDGLVSPGFMDRQLGVGVEWELNLKEALSVCQVFVPVYTTRFFTREWCGKEWDAFARRQAEQRRTRPYTVNAIVPVLWLSPTHLTLPPVVQAVQFAHPDLGEHYLKNGLYGLRKEGRTVRYRRAVWGIAQTIVTVAQQARLDPCDTALFDNLRNVFEEGS